MNASEKVSIFLSLVFGLLLFGAGFAMAWAGGTMVGGALFRLLNWWLQ